MTITVVVPERDQIAVGKTIPLIHKMRSITLVTVDEVNGGKMVAGSLGNQVYTGIIPDNVDQAQLTAVSHTFFDPLVAAESGL